MWLVPLPVALPLLAAALLLAVERLVPLRASDAVAITLSLLVAGICAALAIKSSTAPLVYWFGGWQPRHRVAIGISFVVDPAGAAVAGFAALLFAASFTFAWDYFEDVRAHFHILMLVFLAAICGCSLTADLFNLFVFSS
jgi:multicomponent Na+:H+ antiporter subunit D